MDQYTQLQVGSLRTSPTNPRKHFDKKKMEELKASIAEKGIVVPLLVRMKDGKPEIVAGERRFRSAQELKLETIPCIVRDLTDEQALEIQVIENLQREDVHPLEEAEGFAQLIKSSKGKYTPETIAGKVGKSVTWVYQALKLNDLIPEIKTAFWDEKINRTVAIFIARYSPSIQKKIAAQMKNSDVISIRELKWIVDENQVDLHSGPFKKDDATLVPAAGACTACPKRSGFSPSLFPEIKNKDYCLDTQCFHKKLKAFAQQRIDEIEEKGEKVVTVEGAYGSSIETGAGKKPIDKWHYEQVKDQKGKTLPKGVVRAVITADDSPARIGQTMLVRVKKEEAGSGSDGGSSNRSNRPSKAELFKRKIEREAVNRIIQQILVKVNVPQLSQKVFAHFVEDVAAGYMSMGMVDFYKQYLGYDWLKAYNGAGNFEKKIHDPKTPIGELHKIGLVGLLFKRFSAGAPDDFAELLKIDADGIRKKVKEEFEAARKAKELGKTKTGKKDRSNDSPDNIPKEQKGGVCRVCGCTEVTPCSINGDPCGWTNNSRSLCDNPKCLKAAAKKKKQSGKTKRKGKKK